MQQVSVLRMAAERQASVEEGTQNDILIMTTTTMTTSSTALMRWMNHIES